MRDAPERIVYVRPRTILIVIGIVLVVLALLTFFYLAWHVITWILIALFFALALNPAVEFFQGRGLGRGVASAVVFALALGAVTGLGFLVIPPLVAQITNFIEVLPDLIEDVVAGRGPLGFLQDDYQIVERARAAIEERGAGGVVGLGAPALAPRRPLL
jgi:predicted PurR-regulated permease PerM